MTMDHFDLGDLFAKASDQLLYFLHSDLVSLFVFMEEAGTNSVFAIGVKNRSSPSCINPL